jgi:hypothetical protein
MLPLLSLLTGIWLMWVAEVCSWCVEVARPEYARHVVSEKHHMQQHHHITSARSSALKLVVLMHIFVLLTLWEYAFQTVQAVWAGSRCLTFTHNLVVDVMLNACVKTYCRHVCFNQLWRLHVQKGSKKKTENASWARVKAASSWQEVQRGISCYADGSYSQLPLGLVLSAYMAVDRCLSSEHAVSGVGAAEGTGVWEGVDEVR